jgi:light-regulated signal transduction histidine kinase (bacteriophytochrome)
MTIALVPHDTPIDLSNCDREPIHIPGQVQSHGVLFAVARSNWSITASEQQCGGLLRHGPGRAARLGSAPMARAP